MCEIFPRVSDLEVLIEAQQSYWLYQNISPSGTRLKENAGVCVLKSVWFSFAGLLFYTNVDYILINVFQFYFHDKQYIF